MGTQLKGYTQGVIFRYFRESLALTREDMKSHLGVSESTIKRIERGLCPVPSYLHEGLEELGLTEEMLVTGKVAIEPDEYAFKLPDRFAINPFTSGRTFNLLRSHFVSRMGVAGWDSFLKSEGINPLRFVNENNSASVKLTQRIMQVFVSKGMFQMNELVDLTQAQYCELFGDLGDLNTKIIMMDQILEVVDRYDNNLQWEIEDRSRKTNSLDISVTPMGHMDVDGLFRHDLIAENAFDQWLGAIIKGIGVPVRLRETIHKGGKRCILQVG